MSSTGTSPATPRVGMGTRIAYGVGDTASNLVFQMSIIYLLFFYTDVMKLDPALAGLIFMIARIWDAVNDPLMGFVQDHTRSRQGSSRAFLLWGALPLGMATVLLFWVPPWQGPGLFAWALGTYILWGMLYTMVNIPYSSMTALLSSDPLERTRISAVRMVCMLAAVVVVSVATEPLLDIFPDRRTGFTAVAALYGSLAALLFLVCHRGTRNTAARTPPRQESYSLPQALGILGRNTPALVISLTFFLGSSAEYIRETSVVYYVTCNMGMPDLIPLFLGTVVLAMVAGNLVMGTLVARLDKKGTYLAGISLAGAASLVFQWLPPDNLPAILGCAALSSLGFSVVSTMGWAMLPDTVEYGQDRTGRRSEGLLYAFFSFSQKLATAVGGGTVSLILAVTGYRAGEAAQTSAALTGIASTLGFIPAVFLGLSAVAVSFYGLDRKTHGDIRARLDQTTAS